MTILNAANLKEYRETIAIIGSAISIIIAGHSAFKDLSHRVEAYHTEAMVRVDQTNRELEAVREVAERSDASMRSIRDDVNAMKIQQARIDQQIINMRESLLEFRESRM